MLLFAIMFGTATSFAGPSKSYTKLYDWHYSEPPNIVICEYSQTSRDTIDEAVKFWEKKGYKLGNVYTNTSACQRDWSPNTIMFVGQGDLDISIHNGLTTPWFKPGTQRLVSAVIQVEAAAANNVELVAHELGHGLGLDHSPDQNSVMYPTKSY
jgi:hypothetical protein